MKDREFLIWLHQRIIHHYGETNGFRLDYMYKLRGIICATSPDADSKWCEMEQLEFFEKFGIDDPNIEEIRDFETKFKAWKARNPD